MDTENYLGIYISKDTATVACLGPQGQDYNVLDCFCVSCPEPQGQETTALPGLIARTCGERNLQFSEVAVALDCAWFFQHQVHSDFTDSKQIAATVRFDTEETLATDITDMVLAFNITSSDQTGSGLTVFTARRKILTDILLSLQSNNLDPVTMEPDINCLSRFVRRNIPLPEGSHPLFGMLSRRRGYLIAPPSSPRSPQRTPLLRTFLVGPAQSRTDLLARETLVTAALIKDGPSIDCLKVINSAATVDYRLLSSKVGIEATGIDLANFIAADPQTIAHCDDPVDLAIACGAALAHLEKAQTVNFRNDFMPYQGKKVRLQKALKFASYAVTILMIAIGLHLQIDLWKVNRDRRAARKKFAAEYSAVMPGQKLPQKLRPVTKLDSELRRVREARGPTNPKAGKTVSSKLILVLQAINSCASQTNLNIESVSITDRNVNIVGDTSSRTNTLKFFEAITKNSMEILQQRLYTKESRDHFSIIVVPKTG